MQPSYQGHQLMLTQVSQSWVVSTHGGAAGLFDGFKSLSANFPVLVLSLLAQRQLAGSLKDMLVILLGHGRRKDQLAGSQSQAQVLMRLRTLGTGLQQTTRLS